MRLPAANSKAYFGIKKYLYPTIFIHAEIILNNDTRPDFYKEKFYKITDSYILQYFCVTDILLNYLFFYIYIK